MDVDYASADVGRQIAGALRRSALAAKHSESLPAFLQVDPRAVFSMWRRAFSARRRAANNGTEGAADEQIKLCQNLEPYFELEGTWRRLMNRLGRDHIEPAVDAQARRSPRSEPAALRAAYDTLVDQLTFDVGVPDAVEVVNDLFEKYDLPVPPVMPEQFDGPRTDHDPERIDARGELDAPDLEDLRSETEKQTGKPDVTVTPVADPPQPEMPHDARDQDSPEELDAPPAAIPVAGGLLGVLGGTLLQVIGERLDRRADRVQDRRREAEEAPTVDGQWYSTNGASFRFSQRGSKIRLDGGAVGVPVRGEGRLFGRAVDLQGFSPAGGPFRCSLELSADGTAMTGQMVDGYGRGSRVELHR